MSNEHPRKLRIGDIVRIELPHSEVCMYMRVAGKTMSVEVREHGAQLLNEDGTPFSIPITWGEAGIYRNALGNPYTYGPDKCATVGCAYAATVTLEMEHTYTDRVCRDCASGYLRRPALEARELTD